MADLDEELSTTVGENLAALLSAVPGDGVQGRRRAPEATLGARPQWQQVLPILALFLKDHCFGLLRPRPAAAGTKKAVA